MTYLIANSARLNAKFVNPFDDISFELNFEWCKQSRRHDVHSC